MYQNLTTTPNNGDGNVTATAGTTVTFSTTTQALTTSTRTTILSTTIKSTTMTTPVTTTPFPVSDGYKFPYPIVIIVLVWVGLGLAYAISRWRQKGKIMYIIPRVFVLCSPRTVQFHYELILRVGLPSYDFNPEKHDIDLTIQGQQKNEVVPTTRLNTKTLLDEPLITSLSLIVYRLVEMPPLGGLVLKHSGPFKSWLYAYDFTIINLSNNKELYYPLNQFIGSLNRVLPLDDSSAQETLYPIDDVPLPQWQLQDIFLLLYTVINYIMLVVTLMPINCSYENDIISVFLAAMGGGALVFFLDWFLYYHLRWDRDRKEYFNEYETHRWCPSEGTVKIVVATLATGIGACCLYYAAFINDWKSSTVWSLAVVNSCTLVIGIWNVSRQADISEGIVNLGLKLRGIEMIGVGMRYSEMVSDMHTKSGSASDDGGSSISTASKVSRSFGARPSAKSLGFDLLTGHPSRKAFLPQSRMSSTGATLDNQPSPQFLRRPQHHKHHKHHKPQIEISGGKPPSPTVSGSHSNVSTISSNAIQPQRSHSDSEKHKREKRSPSH